jgi:hypothetical protein
MRLRDVSPAQHQLLAQLASGISGRLEVRFMEVADEDQAQIGVALREGSRSVVVTVPFALLTQAVDNAAGREQLRTRLKARRDRMMFKTPPAPLPKHIAPLLTSVGPPRGGFRGGGR